MAHDEQRWLTPRLQKAAALCNQTPANSGSPLWLGVDLGTCDVVSMVVDGDGQPVAVCLDWADVVRDGIVWDFFGAVTLVRRHLDVLEQQLGCRFTHAATSFPPGTDPRFQTYRYLRTPEEPVKRDSPRRAFLMVMWGIVGALIGAGVALTRRRVQ